MNTSADDDTTRALFMKKNDHILDDLIRRNRPASTQPAPRRGYVPLRNQQLSTGMSFTSLAATRDRLSTIPRHPTMRPASSRLSALPTKRAAPSIEHDSPSIKRLAPSTQSTSALPLTNSRSPALAELNESSMSQNSMNMTNVSTSSSQRRASLSADRIELVKTRVKVADLEITIRRLSTEKAELKRAMEEKIGEIAQKLRESERRTNEMNRRPDSATIDRLEKEVKQLREQMAEKYAQIESLRTREMSKREEYASREDELNDRLEALQAEIGTVQSDLGQKRTEVKNLTYEVETKSETIVNLQTQLKKSEEMVISQIETERALRMQIKQDAQHVAQNKDNVHLETARAEKLAKLDDLSSSVKYYKTRCDKLAATVESNGTLEERCKFAEHQVESIKKLLAESYEKNEQLQKELRNVQAQPQPSMHVDVKQLLDEKTQEIEMLKERLASGGSLPTRATAEDTPLHRTDNPLDMARKAEAKSSSELTVENERLQERVKALERVRTEYETNGAAAGLDATVLMQEQLADNERQRVIEKLNADLQVALRRIETHKAVSHKLTKEYREMSQRLTGYQLKMRNDNRTFEVQLGDDVDRALAFTVDPETNDLNMLETPFAAELDELAQEFIVGQNSVPLFLAAVLMETMERDRAQHEDDDQEDEEEDDEVEDTYSNRAHEQVQGSSSKQYVSERSSEAYMAMTSVCDSSVNPEGEEFMEESEYQGVQRGGVYVEDEYEEEDEEDEEEDEDMGETIGQQRHEPVAESDSDIECID